MFSPKTMTLNTYQRFTGPKIQRQVPHKQWRRLVTVLGRKERCPIDLLSTNDKASVLHWLVWFVTEARVQVESPTHQKTTHMLTRRWQSRHQRWTHSGKGCQCTLGSLQGTCAPLPLFLTTWPTKAHLWVLSSFSKMENSSPRTDSLQLSA